MVNCYHMRQAERILRRLPAKPGGYRIRVSSQNKNYIDKIEHLF